MACLKVLLVEDHLLLQNAIVTLLSQHCSVVCILERAEELAGALHLHLPDVLVLDVSLPGQSGLQVLPGIRSTFPRLGIVIATNHTQPIYRSEARRRGADGFVAKTSLRQELWPAVEAAFAARRLFSSTRSSKPA